MTKEDFKHCIVSSGFSEWGMDKPIEVREIKIETLEKENEDGSWERVDVK